MADLGVILGALISGLSMPGESQMKNPRLWPSITRTTPFYRE